VLPLLAAHFGQEVVLALISVPRMTTNGLMTLTLIDIDPANNRLVALVKSGLSRLGVEGQEDRPEWVAHVIFDA
jgi:hypothetical protein